MATLPLRQTVRNILRYGLLAGLVATSVSAIGMVQTFDARDVITGVLSLGQLLLFSVRCRRLSDYSPRWGRAATGY